MSRRLGTTARRRPFPVTQWRVFPQDPLERATGIEPAFSAWEADVLPLNYTRVAAIVVVGFEVRPVAGLGVVRPCGAEPSGFRRVA